MRSLMADAAPERGRCRSALWRVVAEARRPAWYREGGGRRHARRPIRGPLEPDRADDSPARGRRRGCGAPFGRPHRKLHRRHGCADARGRIRRSVDRQAGAIDGRRAGQSGRPVAVRPRRATRLGRRRPLQHLPRFAAGSRNRGDIFDRGAAAVQRRLGRRSTTASCSKGGLGERFRPPPAARPDPRRRPARPGRRRRRVRRDRRAPWACRRSTGWRRMPCCRATGDKVRATGRLKAALEQSCVATGEPVPARIDEPFDLLLRSRAQGRTGRRGDRARRGRPRHHVPRWGGDRPWRRASPTTLALALDPYPRSPSADAALKEAGVLSEEQAGPFAALAALKAKLGGNSA